MNKCGVTITEGLKSARFEPVTAMLVCCQVFSVMFRCIDW